jgi:hypothetical protein
MGKTEIQMNTLTSPFSNITEPTTVRRILLREGLADMADDVTLDGWCFCSFNSPEHWCLAIAHRDKNNNVSHRIVTCHKSAGRERMGMIFATITIALAGHKDVLEVRECANDRN